ncbi:MAG: GntR family transcriptional regulator [Prolixibacteraceae bacterium]|jgi:DNA-binding transcriptional regulator YhcF (GntR family)|nr:GntR family transcriptional regulator [Prolixibacteraceae bacterium]
MIFSNGIDTSSALPIYKQVMEIIIEGIRDKHLQKGDKLPSVNAISRELKVAQGTVLKAYEGLKKQGIINSQQGKAFYIANENVDNKLNIFILADRLTPYKEILFNSFVDSFVKEVNIDFNFYNYDVRKFEKLISASIGYYNYYVVMTHFNEDVSYILEQIPSDKLLLLNIMPNNLNGKYAAVYQNFKKDVYQSLKQGIELIRKYKTINLVLDTGNRFQFVPESIVESFKQFCKDYSIKHKVVDFLETKNLKKGDAYFVIVDADLVKILKYIDEKQWKLGSDIGILAYDDTPVREVLAGGITVLSTDFKEMGLTAARLIKENSREIIENPCSLVVRNSL